ncbi:NAD(+) synthase [Chakrabartyella piscis]|uniref:NAD(+) synthase n=1 Tax=Chakrabartyella piscis TaxID=2918914 RepID=UPI0029587575|nr:NAD(+) synthase [Chakrabartyella piscis]
MHHYIKVAAAVPRLRVADCPYNQEEILNCVASAQADGVKILTFPELCVTGYTCADLFFQNPLILAAEQSIATIAEETKDLDMLILLGAPILLDNQTFNCGVMLHKGKLLGIVPKTLLPNYSEFYEERWFSCAHDLISEEMTYAGQLVPIGADLIFDAENVPYLKVGVEICEDLWGPIPPSSYLSLYGATVLLNPSASNELVAKGDYRHKLVAQQSSRCIASYVYASAGIGESTQDTVYSGHSVLYENGVFLGESDSFSRENQVISAHVDLELLATERRKHTTFSTQLSDVSGQRYYREIKFQMGNEEMIGFKRPLSAKPFIPEDAKTLDERCQSIFMIQATGLARRFEHTHSKTLVIGISGGLDSTLALLVAVQACDYLGVSRDHILAVTMPGFGTTDRTYQNALTLMKTLGVTMKEISISAAAMQHFADIEHDSSIHDVTYENTQARERTQILMDLANKTGGLVVGTGDLSELALGWATYNGDHMSMYGVNGGVPKTLVRVLVNWVASKNTLGAEASEVLLDVLDTPVSPELLPPDENGNINQKTEDLVGPYELHDFFLFQVIRFGFSPTKILFLAEIAFAGAYDRETLLKWLKNFYRRFFAQQFKRSCLPDGPKVGALCLSPRGDWRMPTDASNRVWMDEVEKL